MSSICFAQSSNVDSPPLGVLPEKGRILFVSFLTRCSTCMFTWSLDGVSGTAMVGLFCRVESLLTLDGWALSVDGTDLLSVFLLSSMSLVIILSISLILLSQSACCSWSLSIHSFFSSSTLERRSFSCWFSQLDRRQLLIGVFHCNERRQVESKIYTREWFKKSTRDVGD